MKQNLNFSLSKKSLIIIISILLTILIVALTFIGSAPKPTINNPGGTGGDYIPPNTVIITNNGILYEYLIRPVADDVISYIQKAVLYDISVSNNPNASSTYIQLSSLDISKQKQFKQDASYFVTINNNQINSTNKTAWNYWFELTTNDGRHFRLDVDANPENEAPIISIKKE